LHGNFLLLLKNSKLLFENFSDLRSKKLRAQHFDNQFRKAYHKKGLSNKKQ